MKTWALGMAEAPPNLRSEVESGVVHRAPDMTTAYGELLDLAASLPFEAGPTPVARTVLEALSKILAGRALGVCLVVPNDGEPLVELFLPPGVALPGRDPTRLFPELPDERIVHLDGLDGSTLHVAAVHGSLASEPAEVVIVERAARLLASGIRTALTLRSAKPVSEEIGELRAQLIQAEKLASLGQIVAGVVHELANPVTSIVACTDFLLRRTQATAPVDEIEHLKRIGAAADRILKFSRDLVQYARPASETPGAVAIHEIVAQAHAFTEHELERRGISFVADYEEGAPPVLGQAGPLTQVFVNLFTNAAHAMNDQGGRLSVRTRMTDDHPRLWIEVTDIGVGIPPDTLGQIFEPFFTTKEPGRGTGLGLSIVREIVEAHGGSVEAASTPGEGTTFTLSLPLFAMPAS